MLVRVIRSISALRSGTCRDLALHRLAAEGAGQPQRQEDLSGTEERFGAIPGEPQQDERELIMSQRSGRTWCRGKRGSRWQLVHQKGLSCNKEPLLPNGRGYQLIPKLKPTASHRNHT